MDRSRRRPGPEPDPRRNTRLAYSTGGEVEPTALPAPAQAVPAKGGARLRLERRASGRVVTVVTQLPGDADAVARLARDLRAACGTGGTVKDGVVELQGDLREQVETYLRAQGVPSKRAGG
jgi:translation initiation factor 1